MPFEWCIWPTLFSAQSETHPNIAYTSSHQHYAALYQWTLSVSLSRRSYKLYASAIVSLVIVCLWMCARACIVCLVYAKEFSFNNDVIAVVYIIYNNSTIGLLVYIHHILYGPVHMLWLCTIGTVCASWSVWAWMCACVCRVSWFAYSCLYDGMPISVYLVWEKAKLRLYSYTYVVWSTEVCRDRATTYRRDIWRQHSWKDK